MGLKRRWFLSLMISVALGLLVPGNVTAKKVGTDDVIRISNTSPFADDLPLGRHCHELGAAGEDDAEAEVALAVDPTDPEHIVVAWGQDMYDGIVTTTSEDGGATWSEELGVPPGLNGCSGDETANPVLAGVADPDLSIGPDNREGRPNDATVVYLASFTVQGHGGGRLQVSRSFDGGSTWEERVVVDDSPPHHDQPTIAADPNKACHAYLAWTHVPLGAPGIWFSETTDCGESWSSPSHAFGEQEEGDVVYPKIRVLPDGDLLATATLKSDNNESAVITSRSSGQGLGRDWSEPVTVAGFIRPVYTISDPDDESARGFGATPNGNFPAVAPDGTAYVAFTDGLDDGGRQIRVARSTDGGTTWEEPTTASVVGQQALLPTLAVAGDGTVGVTYYDTRNDVLGDDEWTADLFFAHSIDGGQTWEERHLAGPIDLRTTLTRYLPDPFEGGWLGDYNGMAGLPHGFATAFALSQPVAEFGASDIFFTKICFRGGKACFKGGKAERKGGFIEAAEADPKGKDTEMKRKGVGGLLAASMLTTAPTTAAPTVAQACTTESISFENFEVAIDNSKRSYQKGQVARVQITVTRRVQVAGQRAAEEPVEGTDVYLSAKVGESVLVAGGTTDGHGVAKLRVRLKRWITPGWADVYVLVRKGYAEAPCLAVSEYGKASAARLFRVRG